MGPEITSTKQETRKRKKSPLDKVVLGEVAGAGGHSYSVRTDNEDPGSYSSLVTARKSLPRSLTSLAGNWPNTVMSLGQTPAT